MRLKAVVVKPPPLVFCNWMPRVLAVDGYAAVNITPEFRSAAGVAITLWLVVKPVTVTVTDTDVVFFAMV